MLTSFAVPVGSPSVAHARRRAAVTLAGWGVDPASVDVARLLVSELVTNAVRHAAGWAEVTLCLAGTRLRIEVRDESPRPPTVEAPTASSLGGRGMPIVAALATRFGYDHVAGIIGKTVWCELDVSAC